MAVLLALLIMLCSAQTAYAMPIFINVDNGQETTSLDVEPSDTIDSVKDQISQNEILGRPAKENQTLTFQDRVLENDRTLADYNIQKESTLNLEVELPTQELEEDYFDSNITIEANVIVNKRTTIFDSNITITGNIIFEEGGELRIRNGNLTVLGDCIMKAPRRMDLGDGSTFTVQGSSYPYDGELRDLNIDSFMLEEMAPTGKRQFYTGSPRFLVNPGNFVPYREGYTLYYTVRDEPHAFSESELMHPSQNGWVAADRYWQFETPNIPELSRTEPGTYYIYWFIDGGGYYRNYGPNTDDITASILMTDHQHDGMYFAPWDSDNSLPNEEGNYYLTRDVTITSGLRNPPGGINICLNGHTITANNCSVVDWNRNAGENEIVTFCGHNGESIVSSTNNSNFAYINGGQVVLDNVTVSNFENGFLLNGGRGHVAVGTLKNGARITDIGNLGVQIGNGSTLNLDGGTIENCSELAVRYCGNGAGETNLNVRGDATINGRVQIEGGKKIRTEGGSLDGNIEIVLEPRPAEGDTIEFTSGGNISGITSGMEGVSLRQNENGNWEALVPYTITWVNEDGSVLATSQAAGGEMPVYRGPYPMKDSDTFYNYFFTGWMPEIKAADSDRTYTAVFTPEEIGEFDLFYRLDSDEDEDIDNFRDYEWDDTVTATIYLRPKKDVTLQAFDIFMTHADGLVRTDFSSDKGILITEGDRPTDDTHVRIQAVGKEQGQKIAVFIPAGEEYALAQVDFKFADFVNYDIGQAITLTDGSNIAIADTPDSFTPSISVQTKGAEIRGTYTIAFDDNVPGETIAVPVAMTARQMVGEALPDLIPVRTGYTFRGWSEKAADPDNIYEPGQEYIGSSDVTLYAVWEVNHYTVTFKDEDGTVLGTGSYAFGTRTADIAPADPSKEGNAQYSYTFAGWSPALAELVRVDAVYYASYTQTVNQYTVKWQNWDGTVLQEERLDYGTMPEYRGETPSHPDTESETYNFLGWSPEVSTVTGNITYIAQFDPTVNMYDVTFDVQGHGTAPDPQSIGHGGKVNDPGPLTEQGYTFSGWFKDEECTEPWNFTEDTVTESTTIHAGWEEKEYTVRFNANGGNGTVADITVLYTGTVTMPDGAALSRTGYNFVGWNSRTDGNGESFTGDVSMKDSLYKYLNGSVVTLYAAWTANEYVITYELGGGALKEGETNPSSYNADGLPVVIGSEPVRTGYTFDKWLVTRENGSIVNLTDGNTIPAGTVGNLLATAVWTPAEVSYQVEHYQQYIDSDGYVLYETETKTGLTGNQTEAAAKTYTGFTPQTVPAAAIAADGTTVIRIYYDRNYHSVTYTYTNNAPDGAPAAPETVTYKYGKSVVIAAVPVVPGYDFEGWTSEDVTTENGRFEMPDTDVAFTGTWSALDVDYTVEHWQQNVDDDEYTLVETDTDHLTGKAGSMTEAESRTYEGFKVQPYEQQIISEDGTTVVKIYYNRLAHMVSYEIENAPEKMNVPGPAEYRVGALVSLAEIEVPNGYFITPLKPDGDLALDSEGRFIMPDRDVTVSAVCDMYGYTITFDINGGENEIEPMVYTIESEDVLPNAVSQQFRFDGWKVTAADGNWVENAVFNGGTPVTGKYGNVTLTAQWTEKVTYVVEEYKYAPLGWYMLRIVDDLEASQFYAFNGEPMYVISDDNYRIDGEDATFYTLISGDYVSGSKLNLDGFSLLTTMDGERRSVEYNGDVNNDNTVNIADANAVFQMLAQSSYGGYYSLDQLTIRDRLAADMVKVTVNADHRGSIADVNAIVTIVNGTGN